jgi:hypothetical protein
VKPHDRVRGPLKCLSQPQSKDLMRSPQVLATFANSGLSTTPAPAANSAPHPYVLTG